MKFQQDLFGKLFNNMADENEDPNLLAEHISGVSLDEDDADVDMETGDLPESLIIVNVADAVFESDEQKCVFENVFKQYEESATFQYLKSFRRARINYSSPVPAAKARIQLHETHICGNQIKCYFVQPQTEESTSGQPHLQPPPLEKQFLISPPASPPVGWAQVLESEPVVNYDLIRAVANLAPGESHELHPPGENAPAIVVHICEDPAGYRNTPLLQTKRPQMEPSGST